VSKTNAHRVLLAVFIIGAFLRFAAWKIEPPHHPDEYYQYVEPAWLRLTGIGVEPWEWRDGVRSWVLPGYNGAWLALLRPFGLSGGTLAELIQLHWAFISLTLVSAGWRGGALLARRIALVSGVPGKSELGLNELELPGWQGGFIGAALCACFPLLAMQAPHTFSETPSMLALVWSIVLALDVTETASAKTAAMSGFLAALGVCFRIANGPIALIPFAILVAWRNWKLLVPFAIFGIVPIVFFGVVDAFTWGGFLSSYIGYIRFNFIEGKAAKYGISPGDWYWRVIIDRLPTCVFAMSVCVYLTRKHSWPYIASSFGLLAYLTTQAHKEERFIILFWPFFFIAFAGALGGWFIQLQHSSYPNRITIRNRLKLALKSSRVQFLFSILVVLAVFTDSILHSSRKELDITRSFESTTDYSRGLVQAQSWVGKRADLVGAVIEQMGAGYAWFSASAPMLTLDKNVRHSLVRNPALNYAIVMRDSPNETLVKTTEFVFLRSFGNYNVYRKKPSFERATTFGGNNYSLWK
jgi:hypothetical protein